MVDDWYGLVILGCVRRSTEQVLRSKPVGRAPSWPPLQFLPQAPLMADCELYLEINPLLPKLVLLQALSKQQEETWTMTIVNFFFSFIFYVNFLSICAIFWLYSLLISF